MYWRLVAKKMKEKKLQSNVFEFFFSLKLIISMKNLIDQAVIPSIEIDNQVFHRDDALAILQISLSCRYSSKLCLLSFFLSFKKKNNNQSMSTI